MDIYEQAAEKIIKEQENIIGPLAVEQAEKVNGIEINKSSRQVKFQGDKVATLQKLVEQYQHLFGQTSVEVCKEASHSLLAKLPVQQLPSLLR